MAILGSQTIDQLSILTVDVDPTSSGVAARLGSVAMLDNGVTGKIWIKTAAGDTSWTAVPSLIAGVPLQANTLVYTDASGNLKTDTTKFTWDQAAGRLGIGLSAPATPQSTIHIDRGTGVGGHIRFTAGTTTGQAAGDGFEIGIDNAGNAELINYENSALNFFTNSTRYGQFSSTGKFILGANAVPVDITGISTFPIFQIIGTNPIDTQMAAIQYSADAFPPVFNLLKSRGASIGTHALVAADDEFGRLQFRASDGTNFQAGASVRAAVDGTPAAGSMPGRLLLMTTPTGTTTPVERVRINQAGLVRVLDAFQTKRRILDFTSAATANTTTTLTSASTGFQMFTGSTAGQIVRLPDATTLTVGAQYEFFNTATATVAVQDNAGGALKTLSTSTGSAVAILTDNSTVAGVWQTRTDYEFSSTRVASVSLISTNSTTYVLMTNMTITPTAGTYFVRARAVISATSNNRTVAMSVYSDGSKQADSEVTTFIRTGSGFLRNTDIQSLNTDAIVTVNGAQAIELRWRTSGGTIQAQGYGLDIVKLNN